MDHMTQNTPRLSERTYTNLALSACAVLLGVIAFQMAGGQGSQAQAQVGIVGERPTAAPQDGLVSAAEQRKAIIMEIRSLSERVERMQSVLEKGISVKVTSMPASAMQQPQGDKASASN